MKRWRKRKWEQRAKGANGQKRHGRAKGGAECEAKAGEQHDLRQHHGESGGAAGPKRFQNRDRLALALDMGSDRIGDADAADNQRSQADEGQKLRETVEIAGELWRYVFSRPRLPAGVRE